MKINTLLNNETKLQILSVSSKLRESKANQSRKVVSGEYYSQEIQKIRLMSKRQLSAYIDKTKEKPSIKFGLRIAHSNSTKTYRMLDSKVRQDIELINYARNRLYAS